MQTSERKKLPSLFFDSTFYPVVVVSLVAWGVMAWSHASWQTANANTRPTLDTDLQAWQPDVYTWTSVIWLASILALCAVHLRASRRRRQAEEELRRRAQVFRNSYDAILVTDLDYRVLDWNPAAERMFGYTKQELLGHQPASLLSVEMARHFGETARLAVANRTSMSAQLPFYRKNGTEGLCEIVLAAMENESGDPIALIGVVRDITERSRAEKSLQEAMQKARELESIVSRSPAIAFLWRIAEGWPVQFVSENIRQFGYSAEELTSGSISWTSVVHPEDVPQLEVVLIDNIRRGVTEFIQEYRVITKSGAVRWIEDRTIARVDKAGNVTHYQAIVLDVTERKQAEEALRRERDFAEKLIEGAPAIVAVLDTEARILQCNSYMEKSTGYRVTEILGRDAVANFLPEEDRLATRARLKELVKGADSLSKTIPLVTKDGARREMEWISRAIRDDHDQTVCILTIGRDITELKLAQERALQAERLAAIGQMVTGLAHESGNALQRSQACLEMLALEVRERPVAMDLVNRIQLAQDHLHQLYEEVRQYAAPIVLRRESAQPLKLVQQAWTDLEPMWTGRRTRFRPAAGGGDGRCCVDPYAIERVFRNILENSLAACSDPVVIDVSCEKTHLGSRPAVRVAVRDNGPGLNAEQRTNIFEPFYTTKTQGTGLGMAISKRIVEAHGGQIAVGCGEGAGAEIVVILPGE